MESENATPREYLGVLRRHKLIIILVTAALMGAAYVHARSQSPLYQATVRVAVSQAPSLPGSPSQGGGSNSTSQQRFLSTQAQLARSTAAADAALDAAKTAGVKTDPTATAFLKQSSVTADPASDVLIFVVRDSDPEVASQLADAYARGFAAYSAQVSLAAPKARAASLTKQITSLNNQIANRHGKHVATLYNQSALAARDLQNINTYIAFVKSNSVVITTSSQGATKIRPTPVRDVTLAAVLGLILGIIAAFVIEAFSSRVSSINEIATSLKLPVLAQLPKPPRRLERDDRLVLLHEPTSADGEPYRILAARLALLNAGNRRRILVTSATGEEGKSTTVANLAVAFAQAGSRVALVDLDLNKPSLYRFFDATRGPGAAEVARGEVDLHSALQRINVAVAVDEEPRGRRPAEPLLLLPLGDLTDDPSRFLQSPELNQILSALADTCDVVFVDTAPMLLVSHATILSSRVDTLLTIARNDTLTRPVLKQLETALESLPVYKAGLILTNVESTLDYRYGTSPIPTAAGTADTRT